MTTADVVLAEVVYVLSSKALYNLPRQDIKAKLTILLSLKGFVLTGKRTWNRALTLYATTLLDLADTYLVALVERRKNTSIVGFDHDFAKLPGVPYQEP